MCHLAGRPYGRSKLAADQAAAGLATTEAIGAISQCAFNVARALPGHPGRDTTQLIPQLLAVQQGQAPEPATLLADSTRIRTELGWRPVRSTLSEIIANAWTALNSK